MVFFVLLRFVWLVDLLLHFSKQNTLKRPTLLPQPPDYDESHVPLCPTNGPFVFITHLCSRVGLI